MNEKIQILYDLYLTDRQILALRRRYKEVTTKIEEARSEVRRCEKAYQIMRSNFEAMTQQSRKLQMELEVCDQLIVKMESQVMQIRNQKEFVAGKKQLEEARKRRGTIEDQLLELDIKKEDSQKEMTTLKTILDEGTAEYEKNVTGLLEEQQSIEGHQVQFNAQHKDILSRMDPVPLRFYERFSANGLVTPICAVEHDNTCGGCHIQILPQLVNEMMVNPDTYRNCPQCNRILFYVESPEKAKAKAKAAKKAKKAAQSAEPDASVEPFESDAPVEPFEPDAPTEE